MLRIEAVIMDKKCVFNDSMGKACVELAHLELRNNEDITRWFQCQMEDDLILQREFDDESQ